MYPGEQEFIDETIVLESILSMDEMVKHAQVGSMLGSIKDSIQSYALSHVDTSSFTGLLTSLGDIMAPAILFRVFWPAGLLAAAASYFGINMSSIVSSIKNFVFSMLKQGKKPTADDINRIGFSAAGLSSAAAHQFMKNDLIKVAYNYRYRSKGPNPFAERISGPVLTPGKDFQSRGILGRIFGGLTKQRGRLLLVGIIVWTIKTLLSGVGLLALTGAGLSLLGLKKKTPGVSPTPTTTTPQPNPTPGIGSKKTTIETHDHDHGHDHGGETTSFTDYLPKIPSFTARKLPYRWSGDSRTTQFHPNNKSEMWFIRASGNLPRFLAKWVVATYPELRGRISEIMASSGMADMVSMFRDTRDSEYVRVPEQYKTIKQVADAILQDFEVK